MKLSDLIQKKVIVIMEGPCSLNSLNSEYSVQIRNDYRICVVQYFQHRNYDTDIILHWDFFWILTEFVDNYDIGFKPFILETFDYLRLDVGNSIVRNILSGFVNSVFENLSAVNGLLICSVSGFSYWKIVFDVN